MNILVTGALGHIGSQLIRTLAKNPKVKSIAMVDDLSTMRYPSLFNLPEGIQYKFIEGKVQNLDLSHVLSNTSVVIHLAATTDAAGTADRPEEVHNNNYESTIKLASTCLENNVPLIFPSSTSVYGSQESVVDEGCTDLLPQSPYAECKIKEERALLSMFENGLKGSILRLGTIFGVSPGMRFHTAVNKFCWQAIMNQPITVWETALHQKRPYLDLRDACRAFSWVIDHQLYGGEIYNVVTSNHTVSDVINVIKQHVPGLEIKKTSHKIMNQLSYEVLSDKFTKTGFSFNGSLETGIFETVQLLKNCNV